MNEKINRNDTSTSELENFINSNWENHISLNETSHLELLVKFGSAHEEASEVSKPFEKEMFGLLRKVCSMFDFKRSVVSKNDLSEDEIKHLAMLSKQIKNPFLRSCICDLVWVRSPSDHQSARDAIKAYLEIPIDSDIGKDCWDRAITLIQKLNDPLLHVEQRIIKAFQDTTNNDFTLSLANLLSAHKLGNVNAKEIALKLENFANTSEQENETYFARDYYEASIQWYKKIKDEAKVKELQRAIAETHCTDAERNRASDTPSSSQMFNSYTFAIKAYPKNGTGNNDRINAIRLLCDKLKPKRLAEMGSIRLPIDISKFVKYAQTKVSGLDSISALRAFASLYFISKEEIDAQRIQASNKYPLWGKLPSSIISEDGRTVAITPSLKNNTSYTEEDKAKTSARDGLNEVNFIVQSLLLPAFNIIKNEHNLTEEDFFAFVKEASIIPSGRERMFAKGLFFGYQRDWGVALYLLVPQLENLVRCHLKQAGIKTSRMEDDGIETEKGLNFLMKQKSEELFDSNLAFELNALFCSSYGANLRNELAHGLLGEKTENSNIAFYAWWFILRLVLICECDHNKMIFNI